MYFSTVLYSGKKLFSYTTSKLKQIIYKKFHFLIENFVQIHDHLLVNFYIQDIFEVIDLLLKN